MKNLFYLLFVLIGLFATNSCSKDEAKPKPVADFTFTGGNCAAPCLVQFSNNSKDATSYSWNFGDGTTSTEMSPSKTYLAGGTFTVVLVATGAGGTHEISKQVLIQLVPIADFTFTGGGCTAPCAVLLENKSLNATSFSWDFGDGTSSTQTNPTKTYNVGGTYTITLTATGSGGSHQFSKQVLIQQSTQAQLPTANFTFTGTGLAPAFVGFTNTSSNATSYNWDFGDGTSSTAVNPSHSYTTGGSYSVILTATNSAGNNQITKIVNIGAAPTMVKISKVIISAMPFVDGFGNDWDSLNGPDVFFKITDQVGSVLFNGTSSKINNVTASMLPVSWDFTTPFEITDFNVSRIIEVWDYDTPDPDDKIGFVSFTMNGYTTGANRYPSSITKTQTGITVQLDLTWQ